MKKVILSLILCLFTAIVLACDICGCGVGSYYVGILPDYSKRFLGVRYHHKSMQTHLNANGARTPLTTDETYQTAELWGAWNLGKKWRLMTIVPYNFNEKRVFASGEIARKNGLGDVVAMGYYKLFEDKHNLQNKQFVHSLWLGTGIKAPTGKYDVAEQKDAASQSLNIFQLGTASVDGMVNLAYDARLMDAGMNINGSYKFNSNNKHDYRYGNKFNLTALAYYKFNIQNKIRLAPNAGLIFETQNRDVIHKRFHVASSGGNLLAAVAGLEVNMGKLACGLNYQIPVSQKMADNRAKAGNRLMVHTTFMF